MLWKFILIYNSNPRLGPHLKWIIGFMNLTGLLCFIVNCCIIFVAELKGASMFKFQCFA